MRLKFLIIHSVLICQVTSAQNGTATLTASQPSVTTPVSAASSTPVVPPVSPEPAEAAAAPASIMDYKSVYEAATLEEEVNMAAERFSLTPSQKDVWLNAAADRRQTEKQVREKLESKTDDYDKNGVYRGLRTAQTTFHETVIAYLSPTQKQAMEDDRLILNEKQKKMAKLPPPAPTVTVAPVDSAAIKEAEDAKKATKKSKKKKKARSGS